MAVKKVEDSVAGRTAKQIDSAKRAQFERLGQSGASGKRKKCKKGKSCGASCIQNNYVCMVDIPWATSSGLRKVANAIQNRPKKKDQEKPPAPAPTPASPKPKPTPKPKPPALAPQGQFRAPKVPKAAPAKKPKTLGERIRAKVEKLVKELRKKGISAERIKKQLANLNLQGLL